MSSFTIEIAEHKAPPRLIQIDPFQISGSMHSRIFPCIFACKCTRHSLWLFRLDKYFIIYFLLFDSIDTYDLVFAARTLSWFNLNVIHIPDNVIIVAIVWHQTHLDAYKAIQLGELTHSFSNKSSMRKQHVNSFIHEFFTRDSLKPNEKILLEYHSDIAAWYLLEK